MRRQHHAYVAGLLVVVLFVLAAPVSAAETGRKPCLCEPMIRPMDGTTRTKFVASVHYRDPNGEAPNRVEVVVDGVAYPLSRAKGRAHDGLYRARLNLPAGEYDYYFQAENARGETERFPRYGAKPGPWVGLNQRYNRQAILTHGGVHSEQGTDHDIYTFTVHYRDRDDCKRPRRVTAIVDGIRHEMKLLTGTRTNGVYIHQATLPVGPHAYYFEAVDPAGECVAFPAYGFLRGPEVAEAPNRLPTLSDNRILPSASNRRSRYTYTVHYMDANLNPPTVALIYVNDIPYRLKLASGKPYEGLYTHRAKHHIGWDHSYYFKFEDGRGGSVRFPERGAFHGPIVTQR